MDWRCWTLIALIAVAAVGVFWYAQHQQSAWLIKEKELTEESARWQRLAKVHGDSADTAIVKANAAQRQADDAVEKLEGYEKRRALRPKPTTIKGCKYELEDYSAQAAIAERALAYTRIANTALLDTVSEQRGQIAALGNALTAEHELATGWKRQSRRARVKTAFLAIGAGIAGGLAGYAIGVTR